ncbi:MAG: hypothetical protein LUQ65_00930 [Candidatus Helarchaeota archaeon]|nr:hypothetical protein [Candidatus Helarchaeota archaeon]
MIEGYELEDGREVDTPRLDGVLERAWTLVDRWIEQKPELESFPGPLLLFKAIECIDVQRMLDGFKKAGIDDQLARAKVHSHLHEDLMYYGLFKCISMFSFSITHPVDDWAIVGDPLAPPSATGLTEKPPVESELKDGWDFAHEVPDMIGPEATEHLLQATLAFDRWIREIYKSRSEKQAKKPTKKSTKKKPKT